MEEDLERSYLELIDKIRGETRDNLEVLPDLLSHFSRHFSEKKRSIKDKLQGLLPFSPKSKINTIDDLIQQLQKNNLINNSNVSHLSFIVEKLPPQARSKLFLQEHKELISRCQSKAIADAQPPSPSPKLDPNVRELLCQNISNKWQDLARHIGMSESALDQLRIERDHSRAAAKVLDFFEAKMLPQEDQIPKLCEALIAARRKDLADNITGLL